MLSNFLVPSPLLQLLVTLNNKTMDWFPLDFSLERFQSLDCFIRARIIDVFNRTTFNMGLDIKLEMLMDSAYYSCTEHITDLQCILLMYSAYYFALVLVHSYTHASNYGTPPQNFVLQVCVRVCAHVHAHVCVACVWDALSLESWTISGTGILTWANTQPLADNPCGEREIITQQIEADSLLRAVSGWVIRAGWAWPLE